MKRILQNPLMLVAEGFLAGAILFFSTTPRDIEPAAPTATVAAAAKYLGA